MTNVYLCNLGQNEISFTRMSYNFGTLGQILIVPQIRNGRTNLTAPCLNDNFRPKNSLQMFYRSQGFAQRANINFFTTDFFFDSPYGLRRKGGTAHSLPTRRQIVPTGSLQTELKAITHNWCNESRSLQID